MLGSMRGATSGLISDFDLMAAANKAILLGLPVTASSMGTLAQAATVLGRAMGRDAKTSIDDMTTALGRSSPMILDNLGLSVKVGEANEAYARSLGKSADALTEGEKKQAFYNAAMAAAQQKVADLGGVHLTFGDRVQQARVIVGNMVDSLSRAVAPRRWWPRDSTQSWARCKARSEPTSRPPCRSSSGTWTPSLFSSWTQPRWR